MRQTFLRAEEPRSAAVRRMGSRAKEAAESWEATYARSDVGRHARALPRSIGRKRQNPATWSKNSRHRPPLFVPSAASRSSGGDRIRSSEWEAATRDFHDGRRSQTCSTRTPDAYWASKLRSPGSVVNTMSCRRAALATTIASTAPLPGTFWRSSAASFASALSRTSTVLTFSSLAMRADLPPLLQVSANVTVGMVGSSLFAIATSSHARTR